MKLSLLAGCPIPLSLALLLSPAFTSVALPADPEWATPSYPSRLPLPRAFERNLGQADPSVQFLSRSPDATLFLRAGGETILRTAHGSLTMTLEGRAAKSPGAGIEPLSARIHYLIGRDPKKWRTNVSAFGAVKFERVYPGIDLVYRASAQLEYDFLLSPGADPSLISLGFSGASRVELDDVGDLVFTLGNQEVHHRKPRVYQLSGDSRREISGTYVRSGAGRFRFAIGSYDPTLPLIIDPVVSYGTFLGGAGNDGAFSLALDSAANIYVAGITASPTFAMSGFAPVRKYAADFDAFVLKLNPQGTGLLYATYLGGSDQDTAMAVAADAQGNAYVTGGTNSRDFPVTPAAFQPVFGGTGGSSLPPFSRPAGDGFVAKLGPSGNLVYSSYLGGADKDQGYAVAVDSSGTASVAGATSSANFPVTSGALQPTRHGTSDVFIARVNPAGTSLLYSTYLGGSRENYGLALSLDSSGNPYVTGITTSEDFPVTPGAFQSRFTGRVAGFVAKLNSAGTGLAYATYLGGNNTTYSYGLAVDNSGSAYVTGATNATDFPTTPGSYQWRAKSTGQGGDVFVARLTPSGNALVFSSVIGGNGPDFGRAVSLDASGDVYVTGSTAPYGNGRILDFPTTVDAVQRCGTGNPTGFLARLSADGGSLKYSSYLGGRSGGASSGTAIVLGASGKVYVAGSTTADTFPTSTGAPQTAFGGPLGAFDSTNLYAFAGDAFLAQVDLAAQPPMTLGCEANAASLAANLVSPGEIVSFFGAGIGPAEGVQAAFDDTGRLPTVLAGTRVLFDGTPAPLLFVRSDQVNAVTPFALAGKTSTDVQIEYAGVKSPALTLRVTGATPGIFTLDSSGSGQAAALNQDNSYNTPSNPAHPGSIVVLFATGAGPLDPVPEDGAIVQGTLPRTLPASAYIGSCQADVLYSGSAPGLIAGAIQVNLRIPEQAPPPAPPGMPCGQGDVPVVLLFGGGPTQTTATISLR